MGPMTNQQRGATLLVSLIMLVVLTLFVISAINLTSVNLRIAGNMQIQKEIEAAAQIGIEKIITVPLTSNTTTVTPVLVYINNDKTTYYTANVSKTCIGTNISKDTDPTLLIYDSTWDVKSAVSDSRTGANTVIHQGVAAVAGGACP